MFPFKLHFILISVGKYDYTLAIDFQKEGGVMTLTEVYCRFNRARGMEVTSCEYFFGQFLIYMLQCED